MADSPAVHDRFLRGMVIACFAVGAIAILSAVFVAEYIVVQNERNPPMTVDARGKP